MAHWVNGGGLCNALASILWLASASRGPVGLGDGTRLNCRCSFQYIKAPNILKAHLRNVQAHTLRCLGASSSSDLLSIWCCLQAQDIVRGKVIQGGPGVEGHAPGYRVDLQEETWLEVYKIE